MDFISSGCPIEFLVKDEIIHELVIRNLPCDCTANRDELRKIIRQTLKSSRRGSLKFPLEL